MAENYKAVTIASTLTTYLEDAHNLRSTIYDNWGYPNYTKAILEHTTNPFCRVIVEVRQEFTITITITTFLNFEQLSCTTVTAEDPELIPTLQRLVEELLKPL